MCSAPSGPDSLRLQPSNSTESRFAKAPTYRVKGGYARIRLALDATAKIAGRCSPSSPAGLEFRTGSCVLADVPGQTAEQPPELSSADLTGNPEPLDDPVPNGIGEPFLEPVKAFPESAGHLVVGRECQERRAQRFGTTVPQLRQRLRKGHARTDRGREIVYGLRPHFGELALPVSAAPRQDRDGEIGRHSCKRDAHHQHTAGRRAEQPSLIQQTREPARPGGFDPHPPWRHETQPYQQQANAPTPRPRTAQRHRGTERPGR